MIKLPNHHYYFNMRDGFIILYHGHDNYKAYSSQFILIDTVFVYSVGDVLYSLSKSISQSLYDSLVIKNNQDLLKYNYIQTADYIYKQPKNNLVMLNHITTKILLSDEVLKGNLIKDCHQHIIPILLKLTRLDYDLYTIIN